MVDAHFFLIIIQRTPVSNSFSDFIMNDEVGCIGCDQGWAGTRSFWTELFFEELLELGSSFLNQDRVPGNEFLFSAFSKFQVPFRWKMLKFAKLVGQLTAWSRSVCSFFPIKMDDSLSAGDREKGTYCVCRDSLAEKDRNVSREMILTQPISSFGHKVL